MFSNNTVALRHSVLRFFLRVAFFGVLPQAYLGWSAFVSARTRFSVAPAVSFASSRSSYIAMLNTAKACVAT